MVQSQGSLTEEEEYEIAKRSYWGEGILSFREVVHGWVEGGGNWKDWSLRDRYR